MQPLRGMRTRVADKNFLNGVVDSARIHHAGEFRVSERLGHVEDLRGGAEWGGAEELVVDRKGSFRHFAGGERGGDALLAGRG